MINTIFLDLDGPLLDGRFRHYSCYSGILNEGGFLPVDFNSYWDGKRSRLDRRTLLKKSDAIDFYDEFLHEWLQRIELPVMLALDQLQPDVLSILSDWKDSEIEVVIATMRNHVSNTFNQLTSLGIMPLVSQVLVTGSYKGFAGKVEAARRVLSDNIPRTALWVGDTEVDIHAARSLNIPVCALTCGLRTQELLAAEKPDYLLNDLRDVRQHVDQMITGC